MAKQAKHTHIQTQDRPASAEPAPAAKQAPVVKQNWLMLALFILLPLAAGAIGSLVTFDAIPAWYATLAKPSFAPPNWLFGPVWTTLYVLMGISAYLIWQKGRESGKVKSALTMFGIQLALNVLWSILFFGFRSPFYGLLCIILLWLAIAYCIRLFHPIDKRAAYLLVPYILWVTFASLLNFSIWALNG